MIHLAMNLLTNPEDLAPENFGMWVFLSVGAVSLFVVFIPLVSWIESRRKEREAFYKAETFRRLAESSGEGAQAAVALLREQDRLKRIRGIEGMKVAGVINIAVGLALVIFLRVLIGTGQGSPFLCGIIPGFIGVAMLVYAYFLAAPVE